MASNSRYLPATAVEKAPYDYQRELSVFLKLTFFQVFNVLVTMYATLYDPRASEAGRDTLRGWLSYASPVIMVPQVAIGALGKMQTVPAFDDEGNVVPRRFLQVMNE